MPESVNTFNRSTILERTHVRHLATNNGKPTLGTTSKALSLLHLFSRKTPELGLSDIARKSGLNKATVYRLMSEMASHGFVEQTGMSREYRLGPAFLRLAALREHNVPMKEMAMAVLSEVARNTGETAHMSLLQGDVLAMLAYSYSDAHGTSVHMEDADTLTFHGTSSGLAFLAFCDDEQRTKILSSKLEKRTPQTIVDPDQVRELLPDIRNTGISVAVGGFEEDVFSHATPIFDANTSCIGALAVAAPVTRMTDDLRTLIRNEVLSQGRRLTRLLGGFLPERFPEPDERIDT